MKNVFKTFMIILVSLIVVPFTVNAATTTYEDLPNGSYVIGKHIFTREGGALTVKKIMLASRTIESENIDDMKIIYKDIMGNLKEVSAGKDADTNQYPDANLELTDIVNYEYYDLVKVIYTDGVIASNPKLGNLVPIKHNGEEWVYADVYEEWYNYSDTKDEWANAVVLSSGVTKEVGDTISEDEIDLWFVWLPRYEYKLPEESIGTTGTPNAIDINFISSSVTTPSEGYSFHPGFAWDSDWSDGISEWKDGIWIGKFESASNEPTTSSVQKVQIKANVEAWRPGNVYNMYTSSKNLVDDYDLVSLDSHMTGYTEWTAISYFTNSIHGRCINSTNCVELSSNSTNPFITGEGDYIQNIGQSTTGNLTGIYDLNGGYSEMVMGYYKETDDFSGFENMPIDNKYTDIFTLKNPFQGRYANIETINGITLMNGVYGELLSNLESEKSWYNDYANSVNSSMPWFNLGGEALSNTERGIFASLIRHTNAGIPYTGFRVALS